MSPSHVRPTDMRGAVRLVTDATAGLTDLVEAVHARIVRLPGLAGTPPPGRTGGITGLVYRSVRGVTRLVGGSLDALLGVLAPALDPHASTPEREAVLAALNGVLGDYLADTGNPLAIPMALRHGGQALPPEGPEIGRRLPAATNRLVVLLHGLCMNDLQWQAGGHDHGAILAGTLGFTPLTLHYNSGRHVSLNGREFAHLLEALVQAWPVRLERLVLLGHSMGGLVARSAVHQACQAALRWPGALTDLVFLGTPHHGAPLERAGHWMENVLGATPWTAPFTRLGRVRSAGITDLRHGNLVDEDWVGRDRFGHGADHRQPVPLPAGVRAFAAAACLGEPEDLRARLLGDGLVPLDSALGRHPDPRLDLHLPPDHQWVGAHLGHLGLLASSEVSAQVCGWLDPATTPRDPPAPPEPAPAPQG